MTYGVIAIAGGQSNAGNLFSGSLNASGKVAFLEAIDAAITDENDFPGAARRARAARAPSVARAAQSGGPRSAA